MKRAPWACNSCHERKVRCDAAILGTPCCNCKLDGMKCVIPTRRLPSLPYPQNPSTAGAVRVSPAEDSDGPKSGPTSTIADFVNGSAKITMKAQEEETPPAGLGQNVQAKGPRGAESSYSCKDDEFAPWLDSMPNHVFKEPRYFTDDNTRRDSASEAYKTLYRDLFKDLRHAINSNNLTMVHESLLAKMKAIAVLESSSMAKRYPKPLCRVTHDDNGTSGQRGCYPISPPDSSTSAYLDGASDEDAALNSKSLGAMVEQSAPPAMETDIETMYSDLLARLF